MLLRNPVVRTQEPGLQVAEDEVDHGQVRLALVRVAIDGQGLVGVAEVRQALIANPAISADGGARRDVILNESAQLLRSASGGQWVGQHLQLGRDARDNLQAHAAGVDQLLGGDAALVRVLPLGRSVVCVLAGADLDGANHTSLMMHALALTARLAAHVALVNLDRMLAANRVAVGANHASADLVEDLKGSFVSTEPKLSLELKGRHSRCLRGNEVGAPEPCGQRRVRLLHHSARGQGNILRAGAAAQHSRLAGGEAVGLANHTARGAGESIGPAQRFKVLGARCVIRENALKLGEARREVSRVHVENTSRRNQLCQLTG